MFTALFSRVCGHTECHVALRMMSSLLQGVGSTAVLILSTKRMKNVRLWRLWFYAEDKLKISNYNNNYRSTTLWKHDWCPAHTWVGRCMSELNTVVMLPSHYWQPLSPNGTWHDSPTDDPDLFIICSFFLYTKLHFFQITATPHIELH